MLTVLSFGAGQDSSCLLELYIKLPQFRERYAPHDFLVLMSDTGDEFPATYKHVESTRQRCQKLGIAFHLITSDQGFHSDSWLSLRHFYKAKNAIGSVAFPKTCTDRLKLEPFYRYLEHYLSQKYNVKHGRKQGFYEFKDRYGKINIMLGIGYDEQKRIQPIEKHKAKWYRECINPIYPLIDLKMTRQDCQDVLHGQGMVVVPSNCMACPYMCDAEVEYMRRFHPKSLHEWQQLEHNKLIAHSGAERNLGVFGRTTLSQKVQDVAEKFSDWTDQDIQLFRYSHGHNVKSKY